MELDILIEDKLSKLLDGGLFERFGNLYLDYRYNEAFKYTSLGTKIGKNRSVQGQPDTYFSLPDNKFIFVEYTITDKDDLFSKLKRDIRACLDPKKRGVSLEQIAKIDLVFCGRITPEQETELRGLSEGIPVDFHNIYDLVKAVKNNNRLANELGITLDTDTGQILSVDEFVQFYEGNRLAVGTPLSNEFLERKELDGLLSLLETTNIVVIHGQKGTGKTKLSLECIRRYLAEDATRKGYCIVDEFTPINKDAQNYFLNGRDYIILIDDANRQPKNLKSVLKRIEHLNLSTVKVLITVRNYAHDEIQEFLEAKGYQFKDFSVGKLSEIQMTSMLKSTSFGITDSEVVKRIIHLAKEDARLAVIIATLFNRGEDITLMSDVSQVYDKYYAIALPNEIIWKDQTCLRVLGLTAVLRAVDLTRQDELQRLLSFLNITVEELWKWVDYLEKQEILEVYEKSAFRFTDQVFATYAFYKCLVIYRVFDLKSLLQSFHESYGHRIKDSVFSFYDSYNNQKVAELIPSVLKAFYGTIVDTKGRLNYLAMYYRFLPDETLLFIHLFAQGTITFEPKNILEKNIDNEVVDLLFTLLSSWKTEKESKVGYELIVNIVDKQTVDFGYIERYLISYLRHEDDQSNQPQRYIRYEWLSNYLIKRALNGSLTHCTLVDTVLKDLLMMFCGQAAEERKIYRDRIWGYVDYRAQEAQVLVKNVIYDYMGSDFGALEEEEILKDISHVTKFVKAYFSPNDALDCHFVHEYVQLLNKLTLTQRSYRQLAKKFNGELYKLYCALSFEHINMRQRLDYEIIHSPKLREKKLSEIHKTIQINDLSEFELFYGKVLRMWQSVQSRKDGYSLSSGLTAVFLNIAHQDSQLFLSALKYIVSLELPERLFSDKIDLINTTLQLNYIDANELYNVLVPLTDKTVSWLLDLFWKIPQGLIDDRWASRFSEHLPMFVRYQPYRIGTPGLLKRYIDLQPKLPIQVLELGLVNKQNGHPDILLHDDFFEVFLPTMENTNSLADLLEESYFNQYFNKRSFDRKRTVLTLLVNRRTGFWMDFISAHYQPDQHGHFDFGNLSFIWNRADYYDLITEAIFFIEKRKVYTLRGTDVECFFEKIDKEVKWKVDQFYERFIEANCRNLNLMEALYEALQNNRHQDTKRFLQLFLTYNKSVQDFSRIQWISRGGTYSGDIIISELRVKEWEKVLEQIEEMDEPLTYILHKKRVYDYIDEERKNGEWEHKDKFFRKTYY